MLEIKWLHLKSFLNQRGIPKKEQGGTGKANQKTVFTYCPVLLVSLFNLFNVGVIIYKV